MKVSKIPNYVNKALKQRSDAGNLRVLPKESDLIDFSSNDYLGLARNVELSDHIGNTYQSKDFIHRNGATGSRLISGNSAYFEEVEAFLAKIFKADASLIFNSGYAANMGVLSSIPQKGDTILYDELSHTCIKDGIRLNFADRFSFKHNDLDDLASKLKKAKGEKYVVVESYYSMDGDAAPLPTLVDLCERYEAYLIVDEAHSTGVIGEGGNGLVCNLGLQDQVFIRIHTFGKAMGAHGACVVADKKVREFLINFSRPFIYTTAMPLHEVVTIKSAFEYLGRNIDLQTRLNTRIDSFKQAIANKSMESILIPSESAIQALVFPGNEAVKSLARYLHENGFNVKPILSPTVKLGQERLRICLHTYDTLSDIEKLTNKIAEFVAKK